MVQYCNWIVNNAKQKKIDKICLLSTFNFNKHKYFTYIFTQWNEYKTLDRFAILEINVNIQIYISSTPHQRMIDFEKTDLSLSFGADPMNNLFDCVLFQNRCTLANEKLRWITWCNERFQDFMFLFYTKTRLCYAYKLIIVYMPNIKKYNHKTIFRTKSM